MRTYGVRVSPKSNDSVLLRRGHRERQKMAMGRRGQRLEPCGCEPRATRSWEKQEGRCPRVFGGSIAVSTPSFSPPGRGDCEEISVCCVKPPGLWSFVMAATGNEQSLSRISTPGPFSLPGATAGHCLPLGHSGGLARMPSHGPAP